MDTPMIRKLEEFIIRVGRITKPFVIVLIISSILSWAWWSAQRNVPFKVLSVEPAFGKPGDRIIIKAHVWRDMTRPCSLTLTRIIFDSAGTPFVILSGAYFDSETIKNIERDSPGILYVPIKIPEDAQPGHARITAPMAYTCNRTQGTCFICLDPITMMVTLPFEILPL
jgi:hypothetical protein